jgi:hypothetical protein
MRNRVALDMSDGAEFLATSAVPAAPPRGDIRGLKKRLWPTRERCSARGATPSALPMSASAVVTATGCSWRRANFCFSEIWELLMPTPVCRPTSIFQGNAGEAPQTKPKQIDALEGRNVFGAPPGESAPWALSRGTCSLRPSARASRPPWRRSMDARGYHPAGSVQASGNCARSRTIFLIPEVFPFRNWLIL